VPAARKLYIVGTLHFSIAPSCEKHDLLITIDANTVQELLGMDDQNILLFDKKNLDYFKF
jgi:hypothetical protein